MSFKVPTLAWSSYSMGFRNNLQKSLTTILIVIIIFSIGFATKAALENQLIVNFFAAHSTKIVSGILVLLVAVGLLLLVAFHMICWFVKHRLGINMAMDGSEIVTGLVDLVTTPEGVQNPSSQDRQRTAVINAGLWWTRRGAMQFYAWFLVTILGGLIGVATLFLLHEQNRKLDDQNDLFGSQNKLLIEQSGLLEDQNSKIKDQNLQIQLQTQANIANSILLEGGRRAALSLGMSNLFEDIRKEVSEITRAAENPGSRTCDVGLSKHSSCRVTRSRKTAVGKDNSPYIYYLSDQLLKRVKSFANASTPYHLAISNGGELLMSKPLEEQFRFVELSPERGFLLKELMQNDVFAGYLNLERADLRAAVIEDSDLSKLNLKSANLVKAHLSNSNLFQTNLAKANMDGAYVIQASLAGIKLEGASLKNIEMHNIGLSGADLSEANLEGAYLSQADLENATLRKANMRSARLQQANFTNANLANASLQRARFILAKLSGANLEEANLQGASLKRTDLEMANLDAAILIEANLEGSNLKGASLVGANLTAANLKSADLSGVHLSYAKLSYAKLSSDSKLSGAWAWSDAPPSAPRELLEQIQICKFDPRVQERREEKPNPCVSE